jgi:L-serine dehydratase
MTVSRKGKNDQACLILEMDSGPNKHTVDYLRNLKWVKDIIYIPDIDL